MSATVAANGTVQVDIPPPDEEEQLLAKLVFGDASSFHDNLKDFDFELWNQEEEDLEDNIDVAEESETEEEGGDAADLAQVQDDQLFFVDDGDEQQNGAQDDDDAMDVDEEEGRVTGESDDDDDDDDDEAWVDSDDERVAVSVVATNKTKKLRESYKESSINGHDYVRRLRAQFEKIYPRPKWVEDVSEDEVSGEEDEDDDENKVINGDVNALFKILESTYTYKDTSHSKLLPSKNLDITRLKDGNASHISRSAVQSLSFHPYKPLLLTGGYDRTLRLYHIDGKSNNMVTSVYLKGTPVQTCSFYVSLNQGPLQEQKIFSGGRRRYMHSWDIQTSLLPSQNAHGSMAKIEKFSRLYGHEESQRSFEKFKIAHYYNLSTNQSHGIILLQGNNGWINILHATTGVWLMGCKINGVLVDFCVDYKPVTGGKFQTILIAVNTYSEVWEFNLTDNGKVLRRWKDEGGVGVTKIQVGGGTNSTHFFPTNSSKVRSNRWLAIGSESGYVNVYDRSKDLSQPKPIAALDQLTTTISSLEFSPDGQILCMASRAIKDALRMVHLPTCTVFSNWPTSGTPFGKVTAVTFSPRGEMLAVGNEQGKVRLWRLNHY
ncbi:hypothetical protein ZYGR_0BB01260 [Zygosaccharomyces rouxii]|uniref:U3 small nucleolar RNA-associated protein 18 n=1 Tax=Zygosaccharomyces rouxii TaxID=4956 RepID=A0A1Q3AKT9_ZYGRO|nr:hypothetical protein ZYGR_0BB01260 [Zygosaccharomyces rouxii]